MGSFKMLKFRSFNGQYTVQNYWDGVLVFPAPLRHQIQVGFIIIII